MSVKSSFGHKMSLQPEAADRVPLLRKTSKIQSEETGGHQKAGLPSKIMDNEKSNKSMSMRTDLAKNSKTNVIDDEQSKSRNTTIEKSQSGKSPASTIRKNGSKSILPNKDASSKTGTADKGSTSKNVTISGSVSRDGPEPMYKGPKRDDPKIYEWTFKYIASMILYLMTLYMILAAFTTAILVPMIYMARGSPALFGNGSFIGDRPKIYIEPNPDAIKIKSHGEFNFDPNSEDTIKNYISRMQWLKQKLFKNDTKSADCSQNKKQQLDGRYTNETCPVIHFSDLDPYLGLGECTFTNDSLDGEIYEFGLRTGEPCFLISFTKLLGVYPEDLDEFDYNRPEILKAVPETMSVVDPKGALSTYDRSAALSELKSKCPNGPCCENYRFSVNCEAQSGQDSEEDPPYYTGVKIIQYPRLGASLCPLPFWNQVNYQQPYVMIKVKGLMVKRKTKIVCRPAANYWRSSASGGENDATITIYMSNPVTKTDQ